MPTFLPGPGPLAPAPHSDLLAVAVADAWASTVQARAQAFYRGSYSAISGAADEAIPSDSTDWASNVNSRAVAFYRAPACSPALVADLTTVLDTWAATTFGRSAPFYEGSAAITISVWDPATNTFADWTPAALLSRAVGNYEPPAAQSQVAWGQSVITDQFAPVVAERGAPSYSSARSLITGIFFTPATPDAYTPGLVSSRQVPAYRGGQSSQWVSWDDHACTTLLPDTMLLPDTVLFPDICPQVELAFVIQCRPVGFYRAPLTQPVSVFTPTLGADFASVAQGSQQPSYRGQRALTIVVYDPAANTFADWTPQPAQSRSVALYRNPPPWFSLAWGASIVTDALGPVTQSRQQAAYRSPAAFLANAYDQPVVVTSTDYVATILSRVSPFYRGSYSAVMGAADEAIIIGGTDWANVSQSWRAPFRYSGSASVIANVFDPATNSFAEWAQVTQTATRQQAAVSRSLAMLGLTSPDAWAQAFQSRIAGPSVTLRGQAISAFDNPATAADTWAQVTQSILARASATSRSRAGQVFDSPAAADTWAQAFLSRQAPLLTSPRGLVAIVFDSPVADTFAPSTQSRRITPTPRSLSYTLLDVAPSFGSEFAPLIQSRREQPELRRPASRILFPLDFVISSAGAQIGLYAFLIAAGIPSAILDSYLDREAFLTGTTSSARLVENDLGALLIVIEGPGGSIS